MDSADDPLVGRVLDGRYEILARQAGGGMATVYRARDRRLGREVAVKILHDDRTDDDSGAATFDREARAAATLHDSHIVGVFDQGEDRGRPFIVMEFVDGCTLRQVIAREAPLPPPRALAYFEPIVSALAVAHEAGLIHRDVKPENVLISARGDVKVGDFGLARQLTAATATATGVLIGTPSYVPPERVEFKPADKRSDVYSAGVMLFELLTGQKPYAGDNSEVARQHITRDMPAPSSIVGPTAIPHWLDELVVACTRRDPELRPHDAPDLLRRVREARAALASGTWEDGELTRVMNPFAGHPSDTAGAPSLAATSLRPPMPPPPVSAVAETTPHLAFGHDEPPDDPPRPGVARSATGPVTFPGFRQEQKYRRRRAIVLTLVLAVLAAAIGTGTWWLVSGRYTDVPDLHGMTQGQATTAVRDAKLTIEFTHDYSEDVPVGQVISAVPGPGARALRDSVVKAVLSQGPLRYGMPPVAGLSLDDAKTALAANHLVTGQVTQEYSDTVKEGTVIRASQEQGAQLKPDTAVDLVVSQGREPITVSTYVGSAADDAITRLTDAGLNPQRTDVFSPDYSAGCPAAPAPAVAKGLVIKQEPDSGTLYKGDTVTLTVSKGPASTTVPDITYGSSVDDAKKALEKAGLVPRIVNDTSGVLLLGVVHMTDPAPGTDVAQCSIVTIHVV